MSSASKKDLIYFAGKVPICNSKKDILPNKFLKMNYKEIFNIYLKKNNDEGTYKKSGAWFFPKIHENSDISANLKPIDIWNILKSKIEISNILVAILTSDSYGTITEASYAAGLGGIAVYAYPTPGMSEDDLKELWFVFNMSLSTKPLWKESHFNHIPNIFPYKTSMIEYESMIKDIVPGFLQKKLLC